MIEDRQGGRRKEGSTRTYIRMEVLLTHFALYKKVSRDYLSKAQKFYGGVKLHQGKIY